MFMASIYRAHILLPIQALNSAFFGHECRVLHFAVLHYIIGSTCIISQILLAPAPTLETLIRSLALFFDFDIFLFMILLSDGDTQAGFAAFLVLPHRSGQLKMLEPKFQSSLHPLQCSLENLIWFSREEPALVLLCWLRSPKYVKPVLVSAAIAHGVFEGGPQHCRRKCISYESWKEPLKRLSWSCTKLNLVLKSCQRVQCRCTVGS